MPELHVRTLLPVSAAQAFSWHERSGAFLRLMPPWDKVEIVENPGHIRTGARVLLRVKAGPMWQSWLAEHREYEPGRRFRDVQLKGPFAHWDHQHLFEPGPTESSCTLHDFIQYRLPMGPAGALFGGSFVRGKLDSMFRFRHATTLGDLTMFQRFAHRPRHRVLISGSSGVIGKPLCAMLTTSGHEVVRLVRPPRSAGPGEIAWDPEKGTIDRVVLASMAPTAVIHLAGVNTAGAAWTPEFKQQILQSRERSTALLASELAKLAVPPAVFASASAVGVYGEDATTNADASFDERSPLPSKGSSFRSDVCLAWEGATKPAQEAGIRVVHMRIGLVLTPAGGVLGKLLPIFNLGVGAKFGSGAQQWPWIAIDDCLDGIVECVMNDRLQGPVNLVTQSTPNAEFAQTLARVLRRPLLGYAPRGLIRAIAGEMGEMLLVSQTVRRGVLDSVGLKPRTPTLDQSLRHLLGRPPG